MDKQAILFDLAQQVMAWSDQTGLTTQEALERTLDRLPIVDLHAILGAIHVAALSEPGTEPGCKPTPKASECPTCGGWWVNHPTEDYMSCHEDWAAYRKTCNVRAIVPDHEIGKVD